jgi:hypothetical protein
MSVDCIIKLPMDVRIRDVAEAVGLLAGLKAKEKPMESGDRAWTFRWVEGVKVNPTSVPTMAEIFIEAPKGEKQVDGNANHFTYYHFENPDGRREIAPRSTAFWIAVGKRLVKFFGGKLDYQDCDGGAFNYFAPKPRKSNSPEDGKPWEGFKRALYSIKPLTMAELKAAQKHAAYDWPVPAKGE